MLTRCDKSYIRTLFLLGAKEQPVGPTELSGHMHNTKEACYQHLHRLEALGLGTYHPRKGFELDENAPQIIEEDIKRHHALEHFLTHSLDIPAEQACEYSTQLQQHIPKDLMAQIIEKMEDYDCCHCPGDHSSPMDPTKLKTCHWIQKQHPSLIMIKEEKEQV